MRISRILFVIASFLILPPFVSCNQNVKEESGKNINQNQNNLKQGWQDSVFFKEKFNDGRKSKYVLKEKYKNDTLIESIEMSTRAGDTMMISNVIYRYHHQEYVEYNYLWIPQLDGRMLFSETVISNSKYGFDTVYLHYPDRSVKTKSYDFDVNSSNPTIINYKQGEYFIDLQRIDTLPGVIPTDYYYIME